MDASLILLASLKVFALFTFKVLSMGFLFTVGWKFNFFILGFKAASLLSLI